MIASGPSWRDIGFTLLLVSAFAFVGAAIEEDDLVRDPGEMVIEGVVMGDVDEDVEVSIVVETEERISRVREVGMDSATEFREVDSTSVIVNETSNRSSTNESVPRYSIPVDRPGKYRVVPNTTGTDAYVAYPSSVNGSALAEFAWIPKNTSQTLELELGERAENVNFTLYPTELVASGVIPVGVRIDERTEFEEDFNGTSERNTTESRSSGTVDQDGPTLDPTWLLVIILSIVGLLVLQFVRTSQLELPDDPPPIPSDDGSEDEVEGADDNPGEEPADTGDAETPDRWTAPGRFENEVYRAWYRLALLAGISSPDEITPGELEREAIAAGLPPAPVRRLTELFNEVRYGDTDPTTRTAEAKHRLETIEFSVDEPNGDRSP